MNRLLAQFVIEGDGNSPGFSVDNPDNFAFGGAKIGEIVGTSLSYVFAAAGIGLLLMIISSGFTLMTSAGDAKKLTQGKTTLTNSLVGFILIFGAFWIVQIVGTALGWQSIFDIFGQ